MEQEAHEAKWPEKHIYFSNTGTRLQKKKKKRWKHFCLGNCIFHLPLGYEACDVCLNIFCEFYSSPVVILPLATGDQYTNIYLLPLVLILTFVFISEKVSLCRNFVNFSQNSPVGTFYMECLSWASFEKNSNFFIVLQPELGKE